jgi:hypothetical protein
VCKQEFFRNLAKTSDARPGVGSREQRSFGYFPAPRAIPAFPGAKRVKPKTGHQGGVGLRRRWKDRRHIYEWDRQHGHLERYSLKGVHQGAFDPDTGDQLKPADPARTVEP